MRSALPIRPRPSNLKSAFLHSLDPSATLAAAHSKCRLPGFCDARTQTSF